MICKKAVLFFILFSCLMASSRAWADADSPFSWGGDLRARLVDLNRIPTEAGMLWSENRFLRFRSRIWGRYHFTPDISFTGRLTNEWREYAHNKGTNNYQAMDEFIIDNAYFDITNLFNDHVDLRIGRQDLKYGTGKIIRLGTPLDSSRTYYFNAAKATIRGAEAELDLLALHVDDEDELAIHSKDRTLVEGEENGGGFYFKHRIFPSVPQEYYYLYKHEQRARNLDLHTVGMRLMPKFSDSLSGNMELAVQDGHRQHGDSVSGELFDVSLFYQLPKWYQVKTVLDLSYYYLSGDDPDTSEEEGWHPVWARFPQYMSYTMVRSMVPNFAAWSNISMPSAGLKMDIISHLNLKMRLALVYAPEDGPGGGDKKCSLIISRLTFKIDKNWSSNIHMEVMDPDDYFANTNDYGHYGHIELMYHF